MDAATSDVLPPVETIPGMWMMAWLRNRAERTFVDEMRDKGFPAYCPMVTRWSTASGERRKIETCAFPGYAFVVAPLDADERLEAIYTIRGSSRLSQRTIVPIVNQKLFVRELSNVQRALAVDADLSVIAGIVPGVEVRIVKGKFADMTGWVESLDRGEVSLRMSFLNTSIVFETAVENIELA